MREVCLVVPCYNEAGRLRRDVFLDFTRSHGDVSVCLVDDGSSDQTMAVLESIAAQAGPRVLVRRLAVNAGKAEAVRQGVLDAASLGRFGFIGYWDADLSTPLTELDRLLAALEADARCGLALGSRVKRLGSEIERNPLRHYLGRVFSTMVSRLLDLAVYDSQCGAKLFRAELAGPLFSEPFVTRWLFDVELLVRLRRHVGAASFSRSTIEVPLAEWREVAGSKLRFSHMMRVPFELFTIRSRYRR